MRNPTTVELKAGAKWAGRARLWTCLVLASFMLWRAVVGGSSPSVGRERVKNIEDISVGDFVQAYHFETGQVVPRKVLEVYRGIAYHLVHVRVRGETITATKAHPFWIESEAKWIEACDLEPGMDVRLVDGRCMTIEDVKIRTGKGDATHN